MFEDQDELKIGLDIQDIKEMSKNMFSSRVRQRVNYSSFQYLLDQKVSRKSENAIGKGIEYFKLKMAEYLNSNQTDMSIDEKNGY